MPAKLSLYPLLLSDEERSRSTLHLTANEAKMSQTAQSALTLDLANRYYFGGGDASGVIDFGPSTYRGLAGVQELVDNAVEVLCKRLSARDATISCLSGVHAMMCAILASTEPGDLVMSIDQGHGGHFATQPIIERTGRRWISTSYDFGTQTFDLVQIARDVQEQGVRAIYLDTSYYLQPHELQKLRDLVGDEVIIIYDASHTAGLIMGGLFQNPLKEGADILCANTHKTLPGPQKGLVAVGYRKGLSEKVLGTIGNGLFSSPNTGSTIALAITILELDQYGEKFAQRVVENANALGAELEDLGYDLRKTGGGRFTENHQLHVFTDTIGEYRELYKAFDANNITVHFTDTLGGRMFMRLGVQELTRRGMNVEDMKNVAQLIHRSLRGETDLSGSVGEFVARFQDIHYSFDQMVERE